MIKKPYEKPFVDIFLFVEQDIVTASDSDFSKTRGLEMSSDETDVDF